MRESGLFGITSVVFRTARDGFGTARAWLLMAAFAAPPLALITLVLLLIL